MPKVAPLILAMDTAADNCAVALCRGAEVLAQRCPAMSRGHAEVLALLVDEVMVEAGCSYSELQQIAVTVGPGSFTGLRVGLSFARALAVALNVPVIGLPNTHVIAAAIPLEHRAGRLLVVALEARRADCYVAFFKPQDMAGDLNIKPDALLPQDVIDRAMRMKAESGDLAGLTGAGDGWPRLQNALGGQAAGMEYLPGYAAVDPVVLAAMAAAAPVPAYPPSALYVRPPDAALPKHGGRLRPFV